MLKLRGNNFNCLQADTFGQVGHALKLNKTLKELDFNDIAIDGSFIQALGLNEGLKDIKMKLEST